jgi:hypothetical protein
VVEVVELPYLVLLELRAEVLVVELVIMVMVH